MRLDPARLFGLVRSLLIYRARPHQARRLRAFYAEFVGRGDLCFDIGAHAGDRIRAFRSLGARVVAVEPQPDLALLLRGLHGRDRNVVLLDCALGAADGQAELRINRRNPTLSTLSGAWAARIGASPRFPQEHWDATAQVRVRTLDGLIAEHGLPVFTKIDVEGAEAEVLAGLSQPLPALSFEYLPELPDLASACLWRLAALGRYVFNASAGESLDWELPYWVGPAELNEWLRSRQPEDGGGDVYARLAP